MQSLRKKLSLSYMLVAVICVLLIGIIANTYLQRQFKNYVIGNHEKKTSEIVESIGRQFDENGNWNNDSIQNIGINALENGLIVKIKDLNGKTIWDAEAYSISQCEAIMTHMTSNMIKMYPSWKGGYVESTYPIMSNSKNVGNIDIGYCGPYYLTDSDMIFLRMLNNIFIAVGIFSLVFALIIGILMAQRLSRPIYKVIETADNIAKGNFGERVDKTGNIKEINHLTDTINNLSETLQTQEKLRKRLTSDVAHELRTPLTTLQGHIEAMIDGVWEPSTDRLKSCHEELTRISRLVGDLQKLAKFEGENLILNKTNFNVSELIKNVCLNFESQYLDKGVELNWDCREGVIFADKDKISQVIVNLVSNALKYTPGGGSVEISSSLAAGKIEIIVKDNGIGISEEDLPHIFERFYRADRSRSRLTGGAGIGLTITKAIVEAHKGKISVESKLNEGTTVKIYLECIT